MDNATVAKDFNALLRATDKEKPAPSDIVKLRDYLVQYPEFAQVTGDLAYQAKIQILDNAMPKLRGTAICVESVYDAMRADMGYEDASAVERSLIEHVCLCWLRLYATELRYEVNMKNATLAQGEYWEKKLSANQRRYLRAVEALARIRKLQQPAPNPLTLALVKQQFNAGSEAPTKKLPKWVNPMGK